MNRAVALALLMMVAGLARARAQPIDFSHGGPVEVTARGGFEWRETEQVVVATGSARAVRGDVTVLGDKLVAHYRKKAGASGDATPPATPAKTVAGEPDSGGNEVYRLDADGNVQIFTPTDEAVGDTAVYDIDQAVLVMTGRHLKLTTPQQVLTARDSMEYWSLKHMAVARGNAVVVTTDGRRISADVLVAYTDPDENGQPAAAKPVVARPADGKPADPLASGTGKIKRVEAYGNVEVRTQADTVRGDRGVYVPDTGIARVVGHVRVTHGDNQINGPAADVNMKTGIAHMLSDPNQRVQGLIVPNSTQPDPTKPTPAKPAQPAKATP